MNAPVDSSVLAADSKDQESIGDFLRGTSIGASGNVELRRAERKPRMLHGFSYVPPTVGRISIGDVVINGDKRIPKKDDEITITAQFKREGVWVAHSLDAQLRSANEKLREIPVRLKYDDPDLSFRESFELFAGSRQLCVGNGEKSQRRVNDKLEKHDCPGPDLCEFSNRQAKYKCKPYARLNVQIDGQDDPFSTFIFRTSGWNSIRVLRQKLEDMHGAFDGKLAGLPLKLVMRGKSTQLSYNTPFFYLDLVVRESSVKDAVAARDEWRDASGINYAALDAAAHRGLANGAFEDTLDEENELEEWMLDGGESHKESGTRLSNDIFAKK